MCIWLIAVLKITSNSVTILVVLLHLVDNISLLMWKDCFICMF